MTFENVSFVYTGRKRTLTDISFDVQPGKRVAIVGQTGSGKSTLASLMVRFYDPDQGRILIDGNDIRELKLQSLRDQLSIVLREPLLLSGTIADNLRYGRPDATEEEVIAAAKAANVHDFISRLKDGYDTELGERGPQLSGGEQQRICVARAFLKDAPILILDEPTSSIDSKTESVILDALLDELMVGRTSFMIAHRLSTIRSADLILVMRNGRVVAEGTHDELLAGNNLYRKLFGVQLPKEPADAGGNGRRRRLERAAQTVVRTGSDAEQPASPQAQTPGAAQSPRSGSTEAGSGAFARSLDLEPIARGPTVLPEATAQAVLSADVSRLRRPRAPRSPGAPPHRSPASRSSPSTASSSRGSASRA